MLTAAAATSPAGSSSSWPSRARWRRAEAADPGRAHRGIQPSIIKDIGRVIRMLADPATMAIVLEEMASRPRVVRCWRDGVRRAHVDLERYRTARRCLRPITGHPSVPCPTCSLPSCAQRLALFSTQDRRRLRRLALRLEELITLIRSGR